MAKEEVILYMTEEYQLRVLPQIAYSENNLKSYLAKEKGLDERYHLSCSGVEAFY